MEQSKTDSPSGRVEDIRRQWIVHEDEALAHRLQSEEISQHYLGNRIRNAIVREDAPRARQEQRKEEEVAMEERLKQLSLRQKQAERDAQLALKLAKKYESMAHSPQYSDEDLEEALNASPKPLPLPEGAGATCLPLSAEQRPKCSTVNCQSSPESDTPDEDYLRAVQEQQDAELAKKIQQELERSEKDRLLAIEAQDRELAKLIHEKEKARIRRAKERARLKAEAADAARLSNGASDPEEVGTAPGSTASSQKSYKTNSTVPLLNHTRAQTSNGAPIAESDFHVPKIPDKMPPHARSSVLGFKANPKKLPPSPEDVPSHPLDVDLAPPYMPIKGFHRSSPRRPK